MIRAMRHVACASLGVLAVVLVGFVGQAHAATIPSDFSLQVTPSPLVTTVKPGQTTQLELKIRNAGTAAEALKIEPRSFTIDQSNQQVALNDTTPPDIAQWISFSHPTFTVQPGQWFTQDIRITLPQTSGFSYSFALVISRQSEPKPTSGGRLIKGSLAVFSLVNVDRPGAVRKLEVTSFSSQKHVYEYLPTTLAIQFKNSGNTIVQPYGNIFIQRSSNSKNPLATLPLNDNHSYILPNSTRALTSSWSDGFPAYVPVSQPNGTITEHLSWSNGRLSKFRIGRYTAKLVAVYNDGQRDVPIEGEVSFWVIPWKLMLGVILLITGLTVFIRWRGKRKTEKAVKKALAAAAAAKKKEPKEDA